jgi:hypothetical protein
MGMPGPYGPMGIRSETGPKGESGPPGERGPSGASMSSLFCYLDILPFLKEGDSYGVQL